MQEPVEFTNNMKQKNKEVKTLEPKKIIFIDKTKESFSDYFQISVWTIEKQAVSKNFEGKWKPHVQAIQWMIW